MSQSKVKALCRQLNKKLHCHEKNKKSTGACVQDAPSINGREIMWKQKIVSPEEMLAKIDPGMSIFLGTGMAEPRTLVKHLMESDQYNLQDLELIQLVSLGDAVAIDERYARKFRLKTFFSGWIASDAISQGRVDLIPSRFSRIPWLF